MRSGQIHISVSRSQLLHAPNINFRLWPPPWFTLTNTEDVEAESLRHRFADQLVWKTVKPNMASEFKVSFLFTLAYLETDQTENMWAINDLHFCSISQALHYIGHAKRCQENDGKWGLEAFPSDHHILLSSLKAFTVNEVIPPFHSADWWGQSIIRPWVYFTDVPFRQGLQVVLRENKELKSTVRYFHCGVHTDHLFTLLNNTQIEERILNWHFPANG